MNEIYYNFMNDKGDVLWFYCDCKCIVLCSKTMYQEIEHRCKELIDYLKHKIRALKQNWTM